MNKKKQARRLVKRLQGVGQHDAAERLIEAFCLDEDFDNGIELTPDESLAEIDEFELAHKRRDLEIFIPTVACLPDDLVEESPLRFDTKPIKIQVRA